MKELATTLTERRKHGVLGMQQTEKRTSWIEGQSNKYYKFHQDHGHRTDMQTFEGPSRNPDSLRETAKFCTKDRTI